MTTSYTPRPYQHLAASFFATHPRCALWAPPGMGKTAAVYDYLALLQLLGSNFFPALVIAPMRVAREVWPAERKKWADFAGIRVAPPMIGPRDKREAARLNTGADLHITSYDNVQWLVRCWGERWPYRIVIADESTKLKNHRLKGGGARAQALAKIARRVGRWINLTGTPAPNGLKDLWGQTWFLDFGERLGHTYGAFMQRWFYENNWSHEVTMRKGADEEIHAKLADITLALRVEDWFDLKQPQVTRVPVELPKSVRALYRRMEDELFMKLGDGTEIDAPMAAAMTMKLLQICAGAVYDEGHIAHELHDAKIEALKDIIEELGEPVVVAYHFNSDRERLAKALPGSRALKDEHDIAEWNAGHVPVLLLHPAAAGHGLNLQYGGRAIVFFTNTWDLELRLQTIERIGPTRQAQSGYNRTVLVYDLVATDTVDEAVLDRLSGKRTVLEALMVARARRA